MSDGEWSGLGERNCEHHDECDGCGHVAELVADRIRDLEARLAGAVEALRLQDPRNAAERYDRIADDFKRETGLWAPGRSIPAAVGLSYSDAEDAERHQRWRAFVNAWHERCFDAVILRAEGRDKVTG